MDGTIYTTDDAFVWSISKIAQAFGMARETVAKRIQQTGIKGADIRNGHPVYKLRDVAPALFTADAIPCSARSPDDMPPRDRRDWYESEKIRLQIEQESGLLITIDEHRDNLADTFKALAMIMDTMPDQLERKHALPANVINDVQNTFDDFRQDMYDSLAKVS